MRPVWVAKCRSMPSGVACTCKGGSKQSVKMHKTMAHFECFLALRIRWWYCKGTDAGGKLDNCVSSSYLAQADKRHGQQMVFVWVRWIRRWTIYALCKGALVIGLKRSKHDDSAFGTGWFDKLLSPQLRQDILGEEILGKKLIFTSFNQFNSLSNPKRQSFT